MVLNSPLWKSDAPLCLSVEVALPVGEGHFPVGGRQWCQCGALDKVPSLLLSASHSAREAYNLMDG